MPILELCKMPFATKHFNKNQRVWRVMATGDLSAKVVGRFRGKGRYVKAWIRYGQAYRREAIPAWQEVMVLDNFYNTIRGK